MFVNAVKRQIMWGDLDSLGIVFYPRYYEWIDASGHLFFEALGLNLRDLWQERKVQFGLVETSCKYHRPGRYHQKIVITTYVDGLAGKTLTLCHEISDADSGTLMVDGREKRICLDVSQPERLRAQDIPQDIYLRLKQSQQD